MTLALFDMPSVMGYPDQCLCGSALPRRPIYAKPAQHCSYWCYLVEFGPDYYTLETIEPWLKANRRRLSHSALPNPD
jgi:hypothetical protein